MGTDWDRLCSLHLRDWSDRFSSWSFCDAAGVRPETAAAVLGWRQLPRATVTLFLHEVTHHALFDSPVGIALASQEMIARIRATCVRDASEVPPGEALRLLEPLLRIDVASKMLKPLNEGIALFAEHEIYDRDFDADLSLPLRCAWQMFVAPSNFNRSSARGPADLSLNGYLREFRFSHPGKEAKQRLLRQPLATVRNESIDGGLSAYLFLKAAYIKAVMSHSPFLDFGPDFFLSYVSWFFFGDDNLALLLLENPSRTLDDAANYGVRVGRYIRQRFEDFFKSFDDESLAQCRAYTNRQPPVNPNKFSDRELMKLASYTGTVRRQGDQAIFTMGDREFEFEHRKGALYLDGPATIESYISPWQKYICKAVIASGVPIMATSTFNEYEKNPEDRLFDLNVNRDLEKAQDHSEHDHLVRIISHLPLARNHLTEVNGLLLEEIDEIYTTAGLLSVPAAGRQRCLELMRDDGLLPILNKTPGLADRYVELSAECAITSNKQRIAAALAQRDISLAELLRDLDKSYTSSGFLFYIEFSNGLIVTLA